MRDVRKTFKLSKIRLPKFLFGIHLIFFSLLLFAFPDFISSDVTHSNKHNN